MTSYQPKKPELQRVKSRLTAASWNKRVEAAEEAEKVVKRIVGRVKGGMSLNGAIQKELPPSRRSWAVRRVPAYRKRGLEVLIDGRLPREPKVSMACRQVVQGQREANPQVTKQQVLELLKEQGIKLPSDATIKREFARVDGRRKYAQSKGKQGFQVRICPKITSRILARAGAECEHVHAEQMPMPALPRRLWTCRASSTPTASRAGAMPE